MSSSVGFTVVREDCYPLDCLEFVSILQWHFKIWLQRLTAGCIWSHWIARNHIWILTYTRVEEIYQ